MKKYCVSEETKTKYTNDSNNLKAFIGNHQTVLLKKTGIRTSYNRFTNTITLAKRNQSEEIIAHEIGHHIDDIMSTNPDEYFTSKNFPDDFLCRYDYKHIKNTFKKTFGFFERRRQETACIQDLVFILSDGKYKTRYRRPYEELKIPDTVKTEVFANLFSIRLMNNPEHVNFIYICFPGLWGNFDRLFSVYSELNKTGHKHGGK